MNTSTPGDELMTRPAVAEYLGLTVKALEQWATQGKGPKFSKLAGKAVRYRRSDVEAWLADQPVSP